MALHCNKNRMTINITVITPDCVIQASDRRMSAIPSGSYDDDGDDANKGLLLQSDDGVFAVTFAGVGRFRSGTEQKRIDLWLAELMLNHGLPELPIEEAVKNIAKAATALCRRFSKDSDRRLSLIIAGWLRRIDAAPIPKMWIIANYIADDGRTALHRANDEFKIQPIPVDSRRKRITVWMSAMWQAIPRPSRRRLETALRRSSNLESTERALVEAIRTAAGQPNWNNWINGNILTIAVASDGKACATHHPLTGVKEYYAPLFLWYRAGRNFLAGDAWAVPSGNIRYRFGQVMLTHINPTEQIFSPESKSEAQIKFLFRFDFAKHKREPVGEVSLIEVLAD